MYQLRISAHMLHIERGRYTRPKTPIENRLCFSCSSVSVEDEIHFITECSAYSSLRADTYNCIMAKCIHFNQMSNEQKMIYMFTSEGAIVKICSKFFYECLMKRKNITM